MPPAMLGAGLAVGLVLWVLARQYDGQDSVEAVARQDTRYRGMDVATWLGKTARRWRRSVVEWAREKQRSYRRRKKRRDFYKMVDRIANKGVPFSTRLGKIARRLRRKLKTYAKGSEAK